MPVVINEFEVVAEPPPAPTASAAAEVSADTPPAPVDVEQIERFVAERLARVWAH